MYHEYFTFDCVLLIDNCCLNVLMMRLLKNFLYRKCWRYFQSSEKKNLILVKINFSKKYTKNFSIASDCSVNSYNYLPPCASPAQWGC